MRVALDYTPAISQVAGVGRYTRSLFAAMREVASPRTEWLLWSTDDHDLRDHFAEDQGVLGKTLPISARWSSLLWHRLGIPIPIERFVGESSVVHGTDFVVPPSRAPSVVTIHDISYALIPELAHPRLRRYLDNAVPRSMNRAARIVAVSETTRRDLCEFYEISPHRVEVIHHAADPLFRPPADAEIFEVQAQFGLRRPYFIIVGTIEPRKDHKTLVRAFAQVNETHPEATLVIVGRVGWLAYDIMQEIRSAAASLPVMHFQGVRDSALPALYAGSTAMVYPSRYEGFGLPVLEAMTSGTAVITSNTPALVEVAGEAALYADPQDDETLAAHMIRLIEQPDERAELVLAGSDRAGMYSWSAAAREHLRVYREVSDDA